MEMQSGYAPFDNLKLYYEIHGDSNPARPPLVLLHGGFATVTLNDMPKELSDANLKVAPHPDNLQSMFDKAVQLMRDFKDIPADKIHAISAPALILCGDSDVMRPEHAVEEFRLLPHAQLAVLPGTNHMQVTARTSWVVSMIENFLDAE